MAKNKITKSPIQFCYEIVACKDQVLYPFWATAMSAVRIEADNCGIAYVDADLLTCLADTADYLANNPTDGCVPCRDDIIWLNTQLMDLGLRDELETRKFPTS